MKYILKTRNDFFVQSAGISNLYINKAKKFKTKKDAENYLEQIRSKASWMSSFQAEIIELEELNNENN